MMFLIMFASLATAMAVVSKGNLRTADTHQRVGRAQGATDAALEIASARLPRRRPASSWRGGDHPAYAYQLWMGTYASTPPVTVSPPRDGTPEPTLPTSIKEALEFRHDADAEANIEDTISLPSPPEGWVVADPIGLDRDANGRDRDGGADHVRPDPTPTATCSSWRRGTSGTG